MTDTPLWHRVWHLVVPIAALFFQAIPPLLIWSISRLAYGDPRLLPASWERPVSLAAVAVCAMVSLALGVVGSYGLFTRARPWVMVLGVGFCCLPALLGGAVYLHAWLVFLTVV